MLYSCTHVATVGVKGLKVIPRLVSMGSSLSSNLSITVLLQGEHLKILTQIDPPSVALGVEDIRWQIAAEWLEISQCSQLGAYRKPPSLFPTVPSMTHYDLLFPKNGGPGSQMHLS